jgi:hypothetical protein
MRNSSDDDANSRVNFLQPEKDDIVQTAFDFIRITWKDVRARMKAQAYSNKLHG